MNWKFWTWPAQIRELKRENADQQLKMAVLKGAIESHVREIARLQALHNQRRNVRH